jgi:hypothetical protein
VVVVEREVLELAARALARDVLALHRLRVRVDRRRGRLEVVGAVADDAPDRLGDRLELDRADRRASKGRGGVGRGGG